MGPRLPTKKGRKVALAQQNAISGEWLPFSVWDSVRELSTYIRVPYCTCMDSYHRGVVIKGRWKVVDYNNTPLVQLDNEGYPLKEKQQAPIPRPITRGRPLLPGLCTHRLGAYKGGEY